MDPRIVVIEESEHFMVANVDYDSLADCQSKTGILEFLRANGLECVDINYSLAEEKRGWFRFNRYYVNATVACKKVPPCGS